ncbi:anti-sigma factor family protein [Mycobacterium sp. WMMD1722]|uniref:anti-sigma factor family protein n=1 Tax=Mycobacterium sp. WMMD1722 TaxID=3404117 RepID=UPI003BF52CC9
MTADAMDCNELVELVTEHLDGCLGMDTQRRFEAHLLECDGCANYVQQFRTTVAILARLRFDDVDPALRARLMTVISDPR